MPYAHTAAERASFSQGVELINVGERCSNCYPGSLDAQKVAGKIVVCVSTDPMVSRRVKKLVAEGSGARGLVLIDDAEKDVPFVTGGFALSQVGIDAGAQILEYINSTK